MSDQSGGFVKVDAETRTLDDSWVSFHSSDFGILSQCVDSVLVSREEYPATVDGVSDEHLRDLLARCNKAQKILEGFGRVNINSEDSK